MTTGKVAGVPPRIDLETEAAVQRCCLDAIRAGIVRSAHDLSDGGLAVALAECCIAGEIGLDCTSEAMEQILRRDGCRPDSLLFGESQSRILLSLNEASVPELEQIAGKGVPVAVLGIVGGDRLRLGSLVNLPVSKMREEWSESLGKLLAAGGEPVGDGKQQTTNG